MRHLHKRRAWRFILAAMLIPLSLIAFWPTPVDEPVQSQLGGVLTFLRHHGIPGWFNYQFLEAAANVMLFMPFGFVSMLAFPEKPLWRISAFGLMVSGCIELGQMLFLHNRFSSPWDLMSNTSGAVIGALFAVWARKKLEARHPSEANL